MGNGTAEFQEKMESGKDRKIQCKDRKKYTSIPAIFLSDRDGKSKEAWNVMHIRESMQISGKKDQPQANYFEPCPPTQESFLFQREKALGED